MNPGIIYLNSESTAQHFVCPSRLSQVDTRSDCGGSTTELEEVVLHVNLFG